MLVVAAISLSVLAVSAGASPAAGPLRLNDLQFLGSHNSYHVESVPPAPDPTAAYSYPPLGQQLDQFGVRQVELDVWADPHGSLWRPLGVSGFKVFHMSPSDMGSTCDTFVECLRQLNDWSTQHPGHLPVAVLVEPKDELDAPGLGPTPIPITTPELDALDTEVRSVMPARRLITPDNVRGHHPSVEDAVLHDGWPTLTNARGRFIFLLLGHHDEYLAGHHGLRGRVMFPSSVPGQPDAAFVNIDEPRRANQATIRDLVRHGYVVRTRADTPVLTPQTGDITQRAAAFASGAQWVSTDYPTTGLASRWHSTYTATLPDGALARCNPIRKPSRCTPDQLTEP
jgi:hypothetical protein